MGQYLFYDSIGVIYDSFSFLAIVQEIIQKASGVLSSSLQGTQKVGKSETNSDRGLIHPLPNGTEKSGSADVQDHTKVLMKLYCH